MSVEAIAWALKQPVEKSSAKFVLVALANCADGRSFECFPSIAYLCDATAQDRKTVIANIKRLVDSGYISDTGERKGRTGGIKAYVLSVREKSKSDPENGTVKQSQERNGSESGTVPKTEQLNDTENGTTLSQTVPFFPASSTENGHETVPKTGHGTVSEPSVNRKESAREDRASRSTSSKITFDSFVRARKETGQPIVPADDPIFEWAESAGLSEDFLRLAWREFAERYRGGDKRYADWLKVYRNAVRNNWFKLWRVQAGQFVLTTEGEMAANVLRSSQRAAA